MMVLGINIMGDKIMKLFISIVCIVMGIAIAIWTTLLQANFLRSIGVSKLGAIAIEPLLIVVSFLVGFRISKMHRIISSLFIIIITIVSLLTISSMYIQNVQKEIYTMQANADLIDSSKQTQKLIQDSLATLSNRGISSKSTIALVDRLQKQENIIKEQATTTELGIIATILANILTTSQEHAIMIFTILISLVTAFAPSFLFFSAGLLIKDYSMKDSKEVPTAKRGRPRKPIEIKNDTPIAPQQEDIPQGHFVTFKKKLNNVWDSTPFRRS